MNKGRKIGSGFLLCVALCLLILDVRSAITGVADGIDLCIRSVIPALFPFLILSGMLAASIPRLSILRPLGKLLGIPAGSESLVIAGLLCGYPVGARMVSDAWKNGQISRKDAQRMLIFCNNAGPAFIFGIGSSVFSDRLTPWFLWGIHILSAFLVAYLLPNKSMDRCERSRTASPSLRSALEQSLVVMAHVCGWVIVFRIVLTFLERWLLWLFPVWLQVLICGILELANGCTSLYRITDPSIRFLMMSAFLAFGGLSVHMQTASVAAGLNATIAHLLGKLMHTSISLILAVFLQLVIYGPAVSFAGFWIVLLLCTAFLFLSFFIFRRKNSSIPQLCGV